MGGTPKIEYTKKQLHHCNIDEYKQIYFRSPNITNNPWIYKMNARKNIHYNGYIILMSIGDMIWDIGEYGGKGFILPHLDDSSFV